MFFYENKSMTSQDRKEHREKIGKPWKNILSFKIYLRAFF